MGKFIFILLLFLYMGIKTKQKQILIECPTKCLCDLFQGFRRARCERGRMLHVLGNIPNHTEILEFSHNYVSELKNHELYDSGLSSLKLANFSHNVIKEIQIYSFEKMSELQILDLSYNALQFILPEWFWSLTSLRELYMNNNNLGNLGNNAILTSATLQVLNLARCQIPHLDNNVFSKINNLQNLDLSENYLTEISEDVIKPCNKLIEVKLEHNNIECDDVGMFFTAYCMENNIRLDYNFCKKTEAIKVEDDEREEIIETKSSNTRNVWIYNIKEDYNGEENLVPEINGKRCDKKDYLIELMELSPIISVIILLTLGFITGLIVGCSCNIKGGRKKKSYKKRTLNRRCSFIRAKSINQLGSEHLMDNIYVDIHSTPIVLRRQYNDNI